MYDSNRTDSDVFVKNTEKFLEHFKNVFRTCRTLESDNNCNRTVTHLRVNLYRCLGFDYCF